MSKKTVFNGLKTALNCRDIPYFKTDDSQCTILFESWEQFRDFDRFLDTVDTFGCKLNIYAEKVNGHSDGVAVTVDDQIQHLGYWTMYCNMKEKVAAFEHFISKVLRTGAKMAGYNYETFKVFFDEYEFHVFNMEFEKDKSKFLVDGVKYYVAYPSTIVDGLEMVIFSLEMPD